MRHQSSYQLHDIKSWRHKALKWAATFDYCAYTNPNNVQYPFNAFKEILAADAKEIFNPGTNTFDNLKVFHKNNASWLFGYLGYNLKNELENKLTTSKKKTVDHPEASFFKPKHLIFFNGNGVQIHSDNDPDVIFNIIESQELQVNPFGFLKFKTTVTKNEYLEKAGKILQHILEGDMYELNLCMEFYAENVKIDPVEAYIKLIELSPTPFSAFYKWKGQYLISASPERFLQKKGNHLLSQPIKGTARRSPDLQLDQQLKEALQSNEKERAENMMIVDLVRNDLARSSRYGTVKVEEIFKVYSFRQWHQMISTISAEARNNIHWSEIIKNAFPMGSMTGAPKIKVMELIDKYENTARGIYSGAFGYVEPSGDFDFNVVIRSLFYDDVLKKLSFHVGSALTYDADPEQEYEECILKASAITRLFNTSL